MLTVRTGETDLTTLQDVNYGKYPMGFEKVLLERTCLDMPFGFSGTALRPFPLRIHRVVCPDDIG